MELKGPGRIGSSCCAERGSMASASIPDQSGGQTLACPSPGGHGKMLEDFATFVVELLDKFDDASEVIIGTPKVRRWRSFGGLLGTK